jgi:hypothetical protein
MSDAIDNLVQDINQNNTPVDEFPGYPGYQLGQEVPGMAGVRIGDLFYGLDPYGQEAPYNWRTGGFEFQAAPQDLSNPSTLATGGEIDYNIPDDPTIRTNIGNTDEKDAFVRTGIGTTLDPKTEDTYGVKGLVPPGQAGGFVGVEYLDPSQVADLTAGQTPSSLPEEFITRGETVKIPGRGLPDYIPIGQMENGDVLYADRNNLRDTIIRPSAYSISQEDVDKGIVPQKFNFGTNTELAPSQKTPTSVGAVEPATTSQGGFDNTGGNVTAVSSGTTNVTPGYKEPEKGPGINPFIDSPWKVATGSGVNMDYIDPSTGKEFPADQDGNKWNFRTGEWDMAKPPGKDTGTTTTPPAGGGTGTGGTTTTPPGTGTGTTPTPGGGTTPTPGGGVRPGTGTGTGTYTGTPLPPREPVTPLVRRETVIPTKGTKEVPIPDRQADPFAQIYADLLANAQQQEDRYRYINYDPDQIMNAAMSGFRRRGAMRSLQGY